MADIAAVGIILVIVGIVLILASSVQKGDAKIAVGGFIGPIPFGWANDPQMLKFVIVLAAIVAVAFLLIFLKI